MDTLRLTAEAVAGFLVLPLRVAHGLHLVSFATVGQSLALLPGFPGIFIRRAWYRATLARCGRAPTIAFGAAMHDRSAEIGDDCFFGKFSVIGQVTIGNDFLCGDHVQLLSGMQHHGFERRDIPIRMQGEPRRTRIHIGADVWIGAGAIVGSDVPDHCIVAAGAVVVKPIQSDWMIVAGVPAREIATRP
jgi:virginiamycin A acetyltransferase